MSENKVLPSKGIEKKGGYTGGKSAVTVGPPAPVPSGSIKPSPNGRPKQSAQ
jgi:hypothetical protein